MLVEVGRGSGRAPTLNEFSKISGVIASRLVVIFRPFRRESGPPAKAGLGRSLALPAIASLRLSRFAVQVRNGER